jgi:thiosulfate/3-mercaptopyruvate sulfurtransferase
VAALADDPRGVVLDVRNEAEYVGENFWPSGAPESVGRPGHIPGAIHFPVSLVRTNDGRFVDIAVLTDAVGGLGLEPSTEIIVYCTIGNRASQVWYALTVLLGYQNVRVFAESWVVWGMDPESMIER